MRRYFVYEALNESEPEIVIEALNGEARVSEYDEEDGAVTVEYYGDMDALEGAEAIYYALRDTRPNVKIKVDRS